MNEHRVRSFNLDGFRKKTISSTDDGIPLHGCFRSWKIRCTHKRRRLRPCPIIWGFLRRLCISSMRKTKSSTLLSPCDVACESSSNLCAKFALMGLFRLLYSTTCMSNKLSVLIYIWCILKSMPYQHRRHPSCVFISRSCVTDTRKVHNIRSTGYNSMIFLNVFKDYA